MFLAGNIRKWINIFLPHVFFKVKFNKQEKNYKTEKKKCNFKWNRSWLERSCLTLIKIEGMAILLFKMT